MADKMEGVETTAVDTGKGATSQQLSDCKLTMACPLRCVNIAIAITANFTLLDQAVAQFDGRFTLRVLRSISSIRKNPHLHEALLSAISHLYSGHADTPSKRYLLAALGQGKSSSTNGDASHKTSGSEPLPEAFVYLAVLVQVE